MRDFNFFESYLQQHQGKEKRKNLYYGVAVLSVAAVLSFPVFNLVYAHTMKKDIAQMKTVLESPEIKAKMTRIDEKQKRIEEITTLLPIVEKSGLELQKADIVNEKLIKIVVDAIPPDVEFTSFNVNPDQMMIMGNARDKSAIAEIAFNLRETNTFKDIFIPNITLNEGTYNFSIQFALKDVN